MAEARRPGRAQREPGKKARAAVRGRPAPRPGRPGARSRTGGAGGRPGAQTFPRRPRARSRRGGQGRPGWRPWSDPGLGGPPPALGRGAGSGAAGPGQRRAGGPGRGTGSRRGTARSWPGTETLRRGARGSHRAGAGGVRGRGSRGSAGRAAADRAGGRWGRAAEAAAPRTRAPAAAGAPWERSPASQGSGPRGGGRRRPGFPHPAPRARHRTPARVGRQAPGRSQATTAGVTAPRPSAHGACASEVQAPVVWVPIPELARGLLGKTCPWSTRRPEPRAPVRLMRNGEAAPSPAPRQSPAPGPARIPDAIPPARTGRPPAPRRQ